MKFLPLIGLFQEAIDYPLQDFRIYGVKMGGTFQLDVEARKRKNISSIKGFDFVCDSETFRSWLTSKGETDFDELWNNFDKFYDLVCKFLDELEGVVK